MASLPCPTFPILVDQILAVKSVIVPSHMATNAGRDPSCLVELRVTQQVVVIFTLSDIRGSLSGHDLLAGTTPGWLWHYDPEHSVRPHQPSALPLLSATPIIGNLY